MGKTRWWHGVIALLAVLIAMNAIISYTLSAGAPGADSAGLLGTKSEGVVHPLWRTMLYIHITASAVALVIGAYQWFPRLRAKYREAHRKLGMVYGLGVLLGGISGLYLAMYATGGWISATAFTALSILWLYTGMAGVLAGMRGQIREHRKWMIRNYALTFAGVTLRLLLVGAIFIFGGEYFILSYTVISWLCWVPNLFVAEWIVRRSERRRAR